MPRYEFQCPKCNAIDDEFCFVRELEEVAAKKKCSCGSKMRRRISVPSIQTDATFFRGVGTLAEQVDSDRDLQHLVKAARRHGYEPGINDMYIPTLAQFKGDPGAFIPMSGGRAAIKKHCVKNNLTCEGMVNHQSVQRPPRPKTRLAEKTIRRYMRETIKKHPDAASTPEKKRALRERIIQSHALNKTA